MTLRKIQKKNKKKKKKERKIGLTSKNHVYYLPFLYIITVFEFVR